MKRLLFFVAIVGSALSSDGLFVDESLPFLVRFKKRLYFLRPSTLKELWLELGKL